MWGRRHLVLASCPRATLDAGGWSQGSPRSVCQAGLLGCLAFGCSLVPACCPRATRDARGRMGGRRRFVLASCPRATRDACSARDRLIVAAAEHRMLRNSTQASDDRTANRSKIAEPRYANIRISHGVAGVPIFEAFVLHRASDGNEVRLVRSSHRERRGRSTKRLVFARGAQRVNCKNLEFACKMIISAFDVWGSKNARAPPHTYLRVSKNSKKLQVRTKCEP